MGFHEVQFPEDLSYGTSPADGMNTRYIRLPSGAQETTGSWVAPLATFSVRKALQDSKEAARLRSFFIARKGGQNGFRFKSPVEHATTPVGRIQQGLPGVTPTDQFIAAGDGQTLEFQLLREYEPETRYRLTRPILKPDPSTVRIAIDGVEVPDTDYTVDETTGKVYFDTPPGDTLSVTWGGEYSLPVRFSPSSDALLDIDISGWNDENLDIELEEILNPTPVPEEFWFGGGLDVEDPTSTVLLSIATARAYAISGTPPGDIAWKLPDPSGLPGGGPYFVVFNDTPNSRQILTAGNQILDQVPAGDTRHVYLLRNPSTGAYRWRALA